MSPETRARLVEEVFLAALEAGPERAEGVLRERCGGDEGLRLEVEELLGHHAAGEGMLDAPVVSLTGGLGREGLRDHPGLFPEGTMVGGHRVLRQIGSGGMGVVYLAEQEKPRRTVVLKIIRPLLATPTMLRRFEREAETLGRLQHPGIAQVYEAGMAETPVGALPFIAMEYVAGEPLTRFVQGRELSLRERVELMARVCDAVQHAHQRGVIHRDLKPGNILVEEGGTPKVLDFGIARAAAPEERATTLLTDAGLLLGTLPYMSPEQVAGDQDAIDTRSDVYSLGVVLYEALTGRLPYDLESRSMLDAARVIREQSPMRLSTLNRTLRGEVEVIVGRALEKERERRYQSAAELAADLRRYLNGEPIEAKRDSALYVLRKQIRRHRVAATAAGVVFLTLVAFGVVSAAQARANRGLANREMAARVLADEARERAAEESERLRRGLYVSRIGFAQAAFSVSESDTMRRLLEECPEDLRGWEWTYLSEHVDESLLAWRAPEWRSSVSFSVVGGLNAVAVSSGAGVLHLRDRTTGESRGVWTTGREQTGVVDSGGERIAFATPADETGGHEIEMRRVSDGAVLWERTMQTGSIWGMSLDSTSGLGVTLGERGGRVFSLSDGSERALLEGEEMQSAAFSADGALIVTGGVGGRVELWESATGRRLGIVGSHADRVIGLAWSPDGARVASASGDGTAAVWDVSGGTKPVCVVRAHRNKVWCVAFSPDGKFLATGGTDATVALTEVETGRTARVLQGAGHTVTGLTFDTSGTRLVSCTREGTIRWWEYPAPEREPVIRLDSLAMSVALDAEGKRMAIGRGDGRVELWGTSPLAREAVWRTGGGQVWFVGFDATGSTVYAGGLTGMIRAVDTRDGTISQDVSLNDYAVFRSELNGARDRLAVSLESGEAMVVDLTRMQVLFEVRGVEEGSCFSAAWSADGARLATCGSGGVIRIWDAADGRMLREIQTGESMVWVVKWTAGGRLLAGCEEGSIREIDPDSGEELQRFVGHRWAVFAIALHPDGDRFASGSFDNTVKVWDLHTGANMLTLEGHTSSVSGLAFDPTGTWLVSSNQDRTVRVWGYPRATSGAGGGHEKTPGR